MNTLFSVGTLGDFKVVTFQTSSLMNPMELNQLGGELDQIAAEQANGRLLLDFTQVEFLASHAIGLIVSLQRKVCAVAGGKLVLCGVSPQLMQLLAITRLDRVLKVVKAAEDALK